MTSCPVCGMMVDENTAPSLEFKGKKYYFMKLANMDMFEKDTEKFSSQPQNQDGH